MAKKLVGTMKLQIKAGQANPSPPVGPALGQRGINIMEFCKAFNEVNSGAKTPSRETVGSVTTKQLREIAEAKMVDLSANDVDQAMKIILGSAKSMGIEVK